MAGKRKTKINLEEVAEKLTASAASAAGGKEAAAGTTGAKQARSAKKKAGKRAGKKKAAKKTAKKTAKDTRKKKKRVKAVPKKRARAKKAKAADAPVEPEPQAPPEAERADHLEETSSAPEEPVELSPEEALALLMQMGSPVGHTKAEAGEEPAPDLAPDAASGAASDVTSDDAPAGTDAADATDALHTPAIADVADDSAEPRTEQTPTEDPGILASILGASCRILTFEGESVDDGMCVARTAIEQLQQMVAQCGLEVSVGPICRTPGDFVAEWDNTPASMPVAIVANLTCAGAFLPAVVDERPRVASAYWIVFETLRSEVSTATSAFLSELRSRHRLRSIGFGPRNLMAAARGGAEAVRGHVEWGFGQGPVPVAS
ncbi:MAG: hypothetical protein ACYTKD_09885 [Planctomycetota bacterium]|jgi:hypothetical protein